MEKLIGQNIKITFTSKKPKYGSFDILDFRDGFILLRGIKTDGIPANSTFWQNTAGIDSYTISGSMVAGNL